MRAVQGEGWAGGRPRLEVARSEVPTGKESEPRRETTRRDGWGVTGSSGQQPPRPLMPLLLPPSPPA